MLFLERGLCDDAVADSAASPRSFVRTRARSSIGVTKIWPSLVYLEFLPDLLGDINRVA